MAMAMARWLEWVIVWISDGDQFVSMLDHKLEPKAVRRVEAITGSGGQRRFPDDEKARIIEETLVPAAVVSAIARRNGLTPEQLFTWRRQARRMSKAWNGNAADEKRVFGRTPRGFHHSI